MKTKEEFNLSEKRLTLLDNLYGYEEKDVKKFIKRLKRYFISKQSRDFINKLAGDKLNGNN